MYKKLSFHPIIMLIYFGAILIFTMSTLHVGMLGISLCLALVVLCYEKGFEYTIKKCFLPQIPMFLLIVFVNGAFNHYGVTSLYMMKNGNSITLESILFGVVMGTMVMSVITWLFIIQNQISTDDVLYLVGRVFPGISLIISMTLRFVPLYKKNLKDIKNSAKALGKYNKKGILNKIKTGYENVAVLFSRSLEESIETANSMQNRGFGTYARTNYHNYHFGIKEMRELVYLLICICFVFYGYATGKCYANYNPKIIIVSNLYVMEMMVLLGLFPIFSGLFYEARNHKIQKG